MNIFQRTSASFQARVVRPRMAAQFEKTKYGKRIAAFKGAYQGRRCFLIGNGPSLRAEDLTRLHENGEVTFAFNRIYNIFEETTWRPTFYVSQDEKMLKGCADIVNQLELPIKFIPIQMQWYYGIAIKDAAYFNLKNQRDGDNEPTEFSNNAADKIYNGGTVMYTAAQLAAYMGFREINLIGVDHHFQVSQNSKGEIVVDNTVKDYFSEKYNPDKENLYIPNVEHSTLTYIAMKKHCDAHGIKVYNATRGGKLEVFPRVNFDSLFEN